MALFDPLDSAHTRYVDTLSAIFAIDHKGFNAYRLKRGRRCVPFTVLDIGNFTVKFA